VTGIVSFLSTPTQIHLPSSSHYYTCTESGSCDYVARSCCFRREGCGTALACGWRVCGRAGYYIRIGDRGRVYTQLTCAIMPFTTSALHLLLTRSYLCSTPMQICLPFGHHSHMQEESSYCYSVAQSCSSGPAGCGAGVLAASVQASGTSIERTHRGQGLPCCICSSLCARAAHVPLPLMATEGKGNNTHV
jgi:hypothetical protein